LLCKWPPIYMESGKEISVSRYKTSYGMDIHTNIYFDMEYVISGSCCQVFKKESHEISRGDIVLLKPESRHEYYTSNELEILKIAIRPEFLPEIYQQHAQEFDTANIIHLPPNEVKTVENILFMIEKEMNTQDEFFNEMIHGYLDVLFSLFIRIIRTKDENDNKNDLSIDFKRIFAYIEKNIKTVTPSSVAEFSCYNFPYFSKLFKKHVGCNLSEYINKKRLEMASVLLLESEKSIENIGYEVGFNHKSYFHRVFKRYYGVTPEEYRKAEKTYKKVY